MPTQHNFGAVKITTSLDMTGATMQSNLTFKGGGADIECVNGIHSCGSSLQIEAEGPGRVRRIIILSTLPARSI